MAGSWCVQAQTLTQALARALGNEPTYLAAKAAAEASREKSRQAFAALLPQVSASAATNTNQRDYLTRGAAAPAVADDFNSSNRQITITQPLWRAPNVIAARQAETIVSQSEYLLLAAEQDLYAKLVAAWCDAMLARDVVQFSRRQVAAAAQEAEVLARALGLGAASAPAAEEARTRHEQARADLASAEADLDVKTAVLEQLVGPLASFTPPFLSARIETLELGTRSLEEWIDRVDAANPTVRAAVRNLEAATEEVSKQRAGHQPTLDLVGSYNRNVQSVGNFPGQSGYEISQRAIGVQLNIPIYSGGAQSAKTGEAIALQEKARQELEAARRAARLAAKQAWFGWQAARPRNAAALQAVRFALLSLTAAVQGRVKGIKTELEILQARQLLESARRDLNRARYDTITSNFRLRAAAGELNEADIEVLQRYMGPEEEDARVAGRLP